LFRFRLPAGRHPARGPRKRRRARGGACRLPCARDDSDGGGRAVAQRRRGLGHSAFRGAAANGLFSGLISGQRRLIFAAETRLITPIPKEENMPDARRETLIHTGGASHDAAFAWFSDL